MSEAKSLQQAQLGAVPHSFQLALEYGGQVCAVKILSLTTLVTQVVEDLPMVDQQANPVAAFEPAEEEVLI